jgi:hypothetical protein
MRASDRDKNVFFRLLVAISTDVTGWIVTSSFSQILTIVSASKFTNLSWSSLKVGWLLCLASFARWFLKTTCISSGVEASLRSVQSQQSTDERIELHQEIMRASDRDKNVFFRLTKNQRSTSSQFTQVLRENDKEASTPEDIHVVFKNHLAKLAKQSNHPTFNEDHDKLVNLDAETIVNICDLMFV